MTTWLRVDLANTYHPSLCNSVFTAGARPAAHRDLDLRELQIWRTFCAGAHASEFQRRIVGDIRRVDNHR